jgi:hypothetical protein
MRFQSGQFVEHRHVGSVLRGCNWAAALYGARAKREQGPFTTGRARRMKEKKMTRRTPDGQQVPGPHTTVPCTDPAIGSAIRRAPLPHMVLLLGPFFRILFSMAGLPGNLSARRAYC